MDRRSTRHKLTRLGIQVMLIGVFGILGGSLNGLNLLIVVASLVLAVLVAQWRMSKSMIDTMRIDRRMPAEAFAGKPVRIRYQVNNESRLMPLWLVRIEDGLQRLAYLGDKDDSNASVTGRSWLSGSSSRSRRSSGEMATQTNRKNPTICQAVFTGVGLLMPGQTTSTFFDVTAFHRGRYRLGRWHVSTVAPFALSMAHRESIREENYMDVYPRLLQLQRSWQRMLPSRIGNASSTAQRQGPSDDVFFGLREYRHGDSPRHIHWRTTARTGVPVVRQFEQQRQYDLCILVDAWSKEQATGSTGGFDDQSGGDANEIDTMAERAISLAASILVELAQGYQNRVLLVVAGNKFEVVLSGTSSLGLRRMLQSLARVQVSSHVPIGEAMLQASAVAKRLPDMLIISSRSQTRAVAADAATSIAIKRWKSRSQLVWVDVTQNTFRRWAVEGSEANE
jgi:uncharacterized protein (DUF58 family)